MTDPIIDIDEKYVTIKLELLDEPTLSSSGKSHIIARSDAWFKSIHRVNGMQIMLPPLTVICK